MPRCGASFDELLPPSCLCPRISNHNSCHKTPARYAHVLRQHCVLVVVLSLVPCMYCCLHACAHMSAQKAFSLQQQSRYTRLSPAHSARILLLAWVCLCLQPCAIGDTAFSNTVWSYSFPLCDLATASVPAAALGCAESVVAGCWWCCCCSCSHTCCININSKYATHTNM